MSEQTEKYALVTGGSRGIGKAVSLRIAKMGYPVLINYRSNKEEAEKTLEEIRANGGDGEVLGFDVADEKDVSKKLGGWLESGEKEVEVLVNNAGFRKDQLFMWMTREEWDPVIKTALDGFYNLTQPVLKGMHKSKFGRIINVVSLSGIRGMAGQTNYSAAKAGMIGATKALAQEVGRRGVTVNAVAPGFIRTDMTEDINEKDYKRLIPAGRFGDPDEVASVVGFLASKEAAYITGEVISVNGGLYT